MTLHLLSLAVLTAGGLVAFALGRRPALALAAGTAGALAGSALGLWSAIAALAGPRADLAVAWPAPLGAVHLRLDPLAAFFQVALFGLALFASAFGAAYLRPHLGHRPIGRFMLAWGLLLASLSLVFSAHEARLFLVAWEVMAVTSFVLVAFEHEEREVRNAGLVYLVASHLGTAALLAFFLLAGRAAGSLDFDALQASRLTPAAPAALLFLLATVGFGTKAGLVPLHVWLPEAHPAAPSHVSALMSGVLVKTGLYGLLRALTFLPPPREGFGLALAVLGLLGALAAITLALGQRDVKRALAYSSVENMGIVFLAVGTAIVAGARGATPVAVLAWSGALLHAWNHAAMKGLAFMAAGGLAQAAGTRDLERMGGLLKRAPRLGASLLVAAAALSALPPFAGFASEWLVYLALLLGVGSGAGQLPLLAAAGLATLALPGGIAAIAFTRIAGVGLLGAPRSAEAAAAREPGAAIWAPLALLALVCLALGLAPAAALRAAAPALAQVSGLDPLAIAATLAPMRFLLAVPLLAGVLAFAVLAAVLVAVAARVRARRGPVAGVTWDCGYAHPTARMQYTASSFSQLFLTSVAPRALQPRPRVVPPAGHFPRSATAVFESHDPARRKLFDRAAREIAERAGRLRRLQADRLNLQLIYTLATLVALVTWMLLASRP